MLLSLLLVYILTFCLYRDMSIRSGVPVEMKRSLVHFHANNVSQQGQKIFEGKTELTYSITSPPQKKKKKKFSS